MSDGLVLFDLDDRGVATVTLNRPDRLNAINMAMRDLIWEYLTACRELPDLRAVVFRGEGRAFSAGADISEFGTAPGIMAARAARHERDLWVALLTLPVPTIAAMHGFCYGAGFELPLCCDRRIAASDTRCGLPEVTLGYIPSAGGTQTLPRIAPPPVAAHMIVTGEPIDSEAAARWGIVDRLVDLQLLDQAVEDEVAAVLAADPQDVMRRRIELRDPRWPAFELAPGA